MEGAVDDACVLEEIELQISRAKEEALSRKEILEKVEKWIAACEEESWLEEYSRDDNRYNAGRGAHLTLRRAEKARVLVNKLPGGVWYRWKIIGVTSEGEDYKFIKFIKINA